HIVVILGPGGLGPVEQVRVRHCFLQRGLHPREQPQLSRLLRGRAVDQIWSQPPARYVIPIEIRRRSTVGKANLEATAQRNGFVLDDTDANVHASSLIRCCGYMWKCG